MRNTSTSLFDLVQKMDKAEKRYFKLNGATYGQKNNYIKLFEAVDRQKTYKEESIKKQFENEAFSNNLHVTKRILFNQILKTLVPNFSDKKHTFKIRELISYAEILLLKGLYKECAEQLVKAKKTAQEYESHEQLLEVLNLEKDLLLAEPLTDKIAEGLTTLTKEQSQVQTILLNKQVYFNWLLNLSLIKTTDTEGNEQLKILSEIIKDPLMGDESMALSYEAKTIFYKIQIANATVNRDATAIGKWNERLIKHLESKNKLLQYSLDTYITALHSLAETQLQLEDFDAFKQSIDCLKNLKSNPLLNRQNLFVTNFISRMLELEYLSSTGQFEEAIALSEELETLSEDYAPLLEVEHLLNLYYDIAYCYFGANKYKSALNWVQKALTNQEKNLNIEVVSYARILYLVLLYERSDYDFLEHQISSASRFLKAKSKLYAVEQIFVKRMNKILMLDDTLSASEQFAKFKNDLNNLEGIQALKLNPYFDFISWVDSKIENIPFGKTLQKKVKV